MKILLSAFLFCILSLAAYAQTSDSSNNNYLNVYLDEQYGYEEYIKTEIPFVNYVRDRFQSQVHILITSQQTGSGGSNYTIFLLGQSEFEGKNDTLHFISNSINTYDESRAGVVQVLKMGLLPYVAKISSTIPIKISYTAPETSEEKEAVDKWHHWVFSINTFVNAYLTSNYTSYSLSGGLSGNKITEKWKLLFSTDANYNTNLYDLGDGDTYESFNNSTYSSAVIVKSFNKHWSYGGAASHTTSTYSNYDLRVDISPAIEYDVFPYSESTTKLLTFLFTIGPEYHNYTDTTIFNETEEFLLRNRFQISLNMTQKWGDISLGLSESNYIPDFDKNSIGCFTSLNWRIVEGLSFNGYFNIYFIKDQFNLAKGDLSQEEILLQIKEQETDFTFSTYFGLSYTFGSIYNNIVNPRFYGYY
ncbi:MAG: hypothetical protein ACHQFW_11645 [Chitinophagales bacterium]